MLLPSSRASLSLKARLHRILPLRAVMTSASSLSFRSFLLCGASPFRSPGPAPPGGQQPTSLQGSSLKEALPPNGSPPLSRLPRQKRREAEKSQ
ncbi:hypothetical protein GCWU000341_02628 [Oribacterium sp. oral taxon 078 str. F0262]|nr:hypothetical protein GCWU000341_02628 [Oribacterium sp. oral taxon 078 str. F0262]